MSPRRRPDGIQDWGCAVVLGPFAPTDAEGLAEIEGVLAFSTLTEGGATSVPQFECVVDYRVRRVGAPPNHPPLSVSALTLAERDEVVRRLRAEAARLVACAARGEPLPRCWRI